MPHGVHAGLVQLRCAGLDKQIDKSVFLVAVISGVAHLGAVVKQPLGGLLAIGGVLGGHGVLHILAEPIHSLGLILKVAAGYIPLDQIRAHGGDHLFHILYGMDLGQVLLCLFHRRCLGLCAGGVISHLNKGKGTVVIILTVLLIERIVFRIADVGTGQRVAIIVLSNICLLLHGLQRGSGAVIAEFFLNIIVQGLIRLGGAGL